MRCGLADECARRRVLVGECCDGTQECLAASRPFALRNNELRKCRYPMFARERLKARLIHAERGNCGGIADIVEPCGRGCCGDRAVFITRAV